MSEDRLVSGLNPLDQWAKPPPIAMSPDLQARPQAPQAPQPGGSPDTIQPSAAKPEVPPQFLSDLDSIIVKKEGGSPTAVSPAGAIGVHQIMPATAAPYLGVPPDKAREMLFDPAVNEKVGKRIIQDLAQRYPGDQQAVLVAYNAGPGAADRWLASGKDPSVLPQETQRYIGEYQQGKGWADEERARHDASFNSNQEMMREFLRLSAAEPAGSAKREELFNKAREASDRATESFEQLRKTPPVYKPVDIMENFGSAAVLIGILGGLFAKRPLTASLNAAGLAMQAQQQQNWDQFKVASEQWKTQAEMGLQQARLAHDQIREVMEDERMAENEKQARLRNVMSGLQLSQQQQNQWQTHYDRMSIATQAALDRADREKQRIEEHNDRMLELQRSHQEQEAARRAATALPQQYVESLDQQWKEANPGKEVPADVHLENIKRAQVEGTKGAAGAGGQQFTEHDVDYWANVIKAGGHFPPGLARTAAGSQFVQRVMAKIPDMADGDPGSFIANTATVKADDRSLSNMTRMADAATSFERTASLNFDLALKLSKDAVPTDWGPWLNKWVMTAETQKGNKDVPPYVTAMLTGANEYAKIMSGSTGAQGSTVDSRREAAELFSPYLSAGQIDRVVAVAKADMGNRKQSLYGQIDDIKSRLKAAGSGEPTATQGQAPGKADAVTGAQNYTSPDDVYKAFDAGTLTKDQAKQLLIDKFGATPH